MNAYKEELYNRYVDKLKVPKPTLVRQALANDYLANIERVIQNEKNLDRISEKGNAGEFIGYFIATNVWIDGNAPMYEFMNWYDEMDLLLQQIELECDFKQSKNRWTSGFLSQSIHRKYIIHKDLENKMGDILRSSEGRDELVKLTKKIIERSKYTELSSILLGRFVGNWALIMNGARINN